MAKEISTSTIDETTMEKPIQYCALVEAMTLNPKMINGTTGMLFLNMHNPFFILRNGFIFYALNHPNTIISVAVRKFNDDSELISGVLPYQLITQLPARISKISKTNFLAKQLEAMGDYKVLGKTVFTLSKVSTHENRKKIIDKIYGKLSSESNSVVQADSADVFITVLFSSKFGGFFDVIGRALLSRFLPELGSKTNWVYNSLKEVLQNQCYFNVKIIQQVYASPIF